MTVDKAFYRHYLEMLLTLNRIQALTPWQMSMLPVSYTHLIQ